MMLNWAARYFPIVRALKQRLCPGDQILEIGAGPFGIGKFLRVPFVGCDLKFPSRPSAPMLPVAASATQLPFRDRSFDAVILSDVLEHIPPVHRMCVVREGLRVARKVAVFGFPSGVKAFEYDLKLAQAYERGGYPRPDWLEEHMRYQPFPTKELFSELPEGWSASSFENEHVAFHNWVMKQEAHRSALYGFQLLVALAPRFTEFLLRRADRAPFYRQIVVVARTT